MSRVILHIGLHKTGTSFIQKRIEASAGFLPKSHGIIPRKNVRLEVLTTMTRRLRSVEQAEGAQAELRSNAEKLGQKCVHENTLISHEDILGPVPTRGNVRGLYPFVSHILPPVLAGFADAGHMVEVVLYTREYDDWLGSVFRYRFKDRPERVFNTQRYKENNALPDNWDGLLKSVTQAVGDTPLHILAFEDDRAAGNMGAGLYDIFGLSAEVQARFVPMEAQNVTRYSTVDPMWSD